MCEVQKENCIVRNRSLNFEIGIQTKFQHDNDNHSQLNELNYKLYYEIIKLCKHYSKY